MKTVEVISDAIKLEMTMAMYVFVCPEIELDERLLEKLWPFARRLPSFYKKYPREDDEAGPSGLISNGQNSNEVDVSLRQKFILIIIIRLKQFLLKPRHSPRVISNFHLKFQNQFLLKNEPICLHKPPIW